MFEESAGGTGPWGPSLTCQVCTPLWEGEGGGGGGGGERERERMY